MVSPIGGVAELGYAQMFRYLDIRARMLRGLDMAVLDQAGRYAAAVLSTSLISARAQEYGIIFPPPCCYPRIWRDIAVVVSHVSATVFFIFLLQRLSKIQEVEMWANAEVLLVEQCATLPHRSGVLSIIRE